MTEDIEYEIKILDEAIRMAKDGASNSVGAVQQWYIGKLVGLMAEQMRLKDSVVPISGPNQSCIERA